MFWEFVELGRFVFLVPSATLSLESMAPDRFDHARYNNTENRVDHRVEWAKSVQN